MEGSSANRQLIRAREAVFLIILFFCGTSYFYGAIFKALNDSVFSIAMPIAVFAAYLLCFRDLSINVKNYLLAILCIFSICFSYLTVGGGLGSVFHNISCALYIIVFYQVKISENAFRFFVKLLTAFHLYLFCYVLVVGYGSGYIGSYNSNTIAMQAFLNMIMFNLFPAREKRLQLLLNATAVFIILYSRSRTSLIAGLVLLMLLFVHRLLNVKPFYLKLAFWIMVVLGITVPIIYVGMASTYNHPIVQLIREFSIEHFNKNIFTGREAIWGLALDLIFRNSFSTAFGIGSHFGQGSNFHNAFITIVICCGFVGYFLMMLLLYRLYARGLKRGGRKEIRSCVIYVAVMLVGFTESVLFSGHFSIFGYLILVVDETRDRRLRKGL